MSVPPQVARRELIGSVVRCAVGGSLIAATGALVVLPARRNDSSQECFIDRVCGACVAFGGCSLPKAVAARRESSRRSNNGRLR
jgi:hypothetical protein